MRRFFIALLAGAAIVVNAGCGGSDGESPAEKPQPDLPAPTPPRPAPVKKADTPPPAGQVRSPVRIVDLNGRPLAGIAPIACDAPNAFRRPVATGALTDAAGRSEVLFPGNAQRYIRGWDPELRFFPNNYYTVVPESGEVTELMELIMAPAAGLDAILLGADGQPLAEEEIGLMLMHPTEGPWWPSESRTNEAGFVRFDAIPAGAYSFRLKALSGPFIEAPEQVLMPEATAHLGPLTLR